MSRRDNQGFTLLEVAVALTILGLVLGATLALVQQYAEERTRMRELNAGNQVAWNQLMNHYRHALGWHPDNRNFDIETTGTERQAGQDWQWQLHIEPAAGFDLFRYQLDVQADEHARRTRLVMYLPGSRGDD